MLGKGRKKKTSLITFKKVAPKKKQVRHVGKLKVIPTSQAEKIAKAVASMIPRPKGKKQSTIESRMKKLKKMSIKLPFEELELLREGKEELIQEKEEMKKPRRARADKGTHKPKWYIDRGLPVPEKSKPVKASTAIGKSPVDIVLEMEEEPVYTKPHPKKPLEEKEEKKEKSKKIMMDEPAPPPPVFKTTFKPKAPVSKEPKTYKAVPPAWPPVVMVNPSDSDLMKEVQKARKQIPKFKKNKTGVSKRYDSETDVAGSDSETSLSGEGMIVARKTGLGLKISAPKKNSNSKSQKGL